MTATRDDLRRCCEPRPLCPDEDPTGLIVTVDGRLFKVRGRHPTNAVSMLRLKHFNGDDAGVCFTKDAMVLPGHYHDDKLIDSLEQALDSEDIHAEVGAIIDGLRRANVPSSLMSPEVRLAFHSLMDLTPAQRGTVLCWFCERCHRYVGPGNSCRCDDEDVFVATEQTK